MDARVKGQLLQKGTVLAIQENPKVTLRHQESYNVTICTNNNQKDRTGGFSLQQVRLWGEG